MSGFGNERPGRGQYADECLLYTEPDLYDLLFDIHQGAGQHDPVRRARLLASERFYLDEAHQANGPVLELACGSGRLTIPLARNGIDIAGADLSASMLEAARMKCQAAGVHVDLHQVDMRQFDLGRKFARVFIPGNSLLHLVTTADLKRCLACVHQHLSPDGRLIFDISKWDVSALLDQPDRRPVMTIPHPERGEVTVEETGEYDSASQVRHIVWYLSSPGAFDFRIVPHSLRVIFPEELVLLLESAAFRLVARYGEFSREPFDRTSSRQVVICEPL